MIAVRPIASVDQLVLAEHVPELIQSRAVEVQVRRDLTGDTAKDLGDLNIDLRPARKFPQLSLVLPNPA